MVKQAIRLNGITRLALTKIDVLTGVGIIKVATGYKFKGKIFKDFPSDYDALCKSVPVYKELKGWDESINGAGSYKGLPRACRDYIAYLSDVCSIDIPIVSIGSAREDTFFI